MPSKSESIAYFEDLGAILEPTKMGSSHRRGWRLIWPAGRTDDYESLLDLWFHWLKRAQRMINEDDTFHAFAHAYENGDDQRKRDLERWVRAYWEHPMGTKLEDEAFTPNWGQSTDGLPRNWKRRVKHLLAAAPENRVVFPHRATSFIRAHTAQ